jgi:hypothetical protein
LGQGQALVDFQAAEAAAVTIFEVGEDQIHQARVVRPLETRQQVAALVVCDGLAGGQLQPGVFESLQVARLLGQDMLEQRVGADEGVVEPGGSVAAALAGLAGVVKVKVHLLPEILQRLLRILVVVEQGLAVEQLPRGVRHLPVPLAYPTFHDLLETLPLAGVLGLQGVEVEVVVRPWDQFFERGFPVTGQAEGFDVADFLGGETPGHQGRQEEGADAVLPIGWRFHIR